MSKAKKSKATGQRTVAENKMEESRRQQAKQTPEQLFASAVNLVEQSQPADALKTAKQLWEVVQSHSVAARLPALNLLGEISIELGAVDSAREYFEKAVKLDPIGELPEEIGGGAEKFLWLAQLCEEGGKESVDWFEKGATALQTEIARLESGHVTGFDEDTLLMMRAEKKRKLANTLCGIVEVYMTDLSWEDDAEARCENLITQAMTVEDETSSDVLQTLASVRLSQDRKDDAQAALKRSLEIWIDLEPEHPLVPDFPTKISLSRLLMEADLNNEAMIVLDRLIQEDDQSVEAWYLGGWCQYLIAESEKSQEDSAMDTKVDGNHLSGEENHQFNRTVMKGSRRWLQMSLKLFAQLEYEDDRLFEHAQELVAGLDQVLGPAENDEVDADDEIDWNSGEGTDDDADMDGDHPDAQMHDS